jgi:transposase
VNASNFRPGVVQLVAAPLLVGIELNPGPEDGRHLNDEQRWKIIHLSKIAFQTPTAIARKVGCSRETVYATLRKYSITGTTKDRPHRGRKRKLSVTDEQSIVKRAKTGMGAKEIAQKMGKDATDIGQKHKTPRVSASTVQRVLKAQGYAYLKVLQHEALTEAHKQKRLQYANDYRNYDWRNVLFSDEKTFCHGTAPTRCWQKPGQRVTRAVSRHPSKLHVWGAVGHFVKSDLFFFTENMDAELYQRILMSNLKESMLHYAADAPAKVRGKWIFLQDNDPKHKAKSSMVTLANIVGDRQIHHPPCSPDLNVMEDMWSYLDARVRASKVVTIDGLQRLLRREWQDIPWSVIRKSTDSMPNRLIECTELHGGRTKY